ncbi:MAG: sulfite exporter TauE/SafE family protein [Verrucomicrobiota bacterium]
MEWWTAMILGLVGSLHCAGMCGPLALALPGSDGPRMPFWLGRLGYNVGRLTAYALLGLIFGAVGQTVALTGWQRWASLVTGAVVLLAWIPKRRRRVQLPVVRAVAFLKSLFGPLLQRRGFSALYALGILNGFLPCGLAYVAGASALALGSVPAAAAYMVIFGLGTVPMMLSIGLLGRNVQLALRLRFQRLIPVCAVLLGLLLVLRGLGLGIPYLSPDLRQAPHRARSCH